MKTLKILFEQTQSPAELKAAIAVEKQKRADTKKQLMAEVDRFIKFADDHAKKYGLQLLSRHHYPSVAIRGVKYVKVSNRYVPGSYFFFATDQDYEKARQWVALLRKLRQQHKQAGYKSVEYTQKLERTAPQETNKHKQASKMIDITPATTIEELEEMKNNVLDDMERAYKTAYVLSTHFNTIHQKLPSTSRIPLLSGIKGASMMDARFYLANEKRFARSLPIKGEVSVSSSKDAKRVERQGKFFNQIATKVHHLLKQYKLINQEIQNRRNALGR